MPYWLEIPSPSLYYISHTLPIDESIMEVMSLEEIPWEYYHHRYFFLPPCHMVEYHFTSTISFDIVLHPQSPILKRSVDSEGNLCNITKTMPVDISVKRGVSENIFIRQNSSREEVKTYMTLFKEFRDIFTWKYEEIPGIDPSIIVHEIKTYPDAKPVCQKLRQVHPREAASIKEEVEKLLKDGFIYPVPLTEWVSNIVLVNKKKGTIRVCINFRDLNRACPKDNFLTPYIDQIIDNCTGSVIFSFMDGFSGYN